MFHHCQASGTLQLEDPLNLPLKHLKDTTLILLVLLAHTLALQQWYMVTVLRATTALLVQPGPLLLIKIVL